MDHGANRHPGLRGQREDYFSAATRRTHGDAGYISGRPFGFELAPPFTTLTEVYTVPEFQAGAQQPDVSPRVTSERHQHR
jgi:hypothetical protein